MSINTIKQELLQHIKDYFDYQETDRDESLDLSEAHHKLFNEDYYIIGYYEASQWLKKHDIGEFESIELIKEYHEETFGEISLPENINSEWAVNQLVYFIGEKLIYDEFAQCETLGEFMDTLNAI